MAIKPILFNTEMVRAIMDGRKSRTRRVVKTRRKDACGFYVTKRTDCSFTGIYEYDEDERMFENQLIPPYKPGDILYVRETWGYPISLNSDKQYVFRADNIVESGFKNDSHIWHPSIHMPKKAARIWLKVTNVRVERLQNITEDEAKAEGAIDNRGFIHSPEDEYDHIYTAREHFIGIWDRTIKKSDLDRYGWEANPYVFVIEFVKIDKPEEIQNA
nr:MAG TPA: hypothetical protein [Caudoviricetes sp.]